MNVYDALSRKLSDLLGLSEPPVAVSFHRDVHPAQSVSVEPQPAGCCFWAPAQRHRIDTIAADHAHCSVGSYTHGFIALEKAAAGDDTAALLGSGWVREADLHAAAALPFTPSSITYEPLAQARRADVVLATLSPVALMRLYGAIPELVLANKPQCVIVPLAQGGKVAVSPGCAVSRTRTGLPADTMTCAIPARDLASIVERLDAAVAADRKVSEFASADIARNFPSKP